MLCSRHQPHSMIVMLALAVWRWQNVVGDHSVTPRPGLNILHHRFHTVDSRVQIWSEHVEAAYTGGANHWMCASGFATSWGCPQTYTRVANLRTTDSKLKFQHMANNIQSLSGSVTGHPQIFKNYKSIVRLENVSRVFEKNHICMYLLCDITNWFLTTMALSVWNVMDFLPQNLKLSGKLSHNQNPSELGEPHLCSRCFNQDSCKHWKAVERCWTKLNCHVQRIDEGLALSECALGCSKVTRALPLTIHNQIENLHTNAYCMYVHMSPCILRKIVSERWILKIISRTRNNIKIT